jgi:hypothetical protein
MIRWFEPWETRLPPGEVRPNAKFSVSIELLKPSERSGVCGFSSPLLFELR